MMEQPVSWDFAGLGNEKHLGVHGGAFPESKRPAPSRQCRERSQAFK
jgi:hypothetical protein